MSDPLDDLLNEALEDFDRQRAEASNQPPTPDPVASADVPSVENLVGEFLAQMGGTDGDGSGTSGLQGLLQQLIDKCVNEMESDKNPSDTDSLQHLKKARSLLGNLNSNSDDSVLDQLQSVVADLSAAEASRPGGPGEPSAPPQAADATTSAGSGMPDLTSLLSTLGGLEESFAKTLAAAMPGGDAAADSAAPEPGSGGGPEADLDMDELRTMMSAFSGIIGDKPSTDDDQAGTVAGLASRFQSLLAQATAQVGGSAQDDDFSKILSELQNSGGGDDSDPLAAVMKVLESTVGSGKQEVATPAAGTVDPEVAERERELLDALGMSGEIANKE